MLEYLGRVAEAVVYAERDRHLLTYVPALHEALAETYQTVWAFVHAEKPDLRVIATTAAVWHARSAALADRRPAVIALLRRRVASGERRAWHVRHLADLDDDVTEYLVDADVDVRTTAALAPTMANRDDATAIIIDALARAAAAPTTVGSHHDPLIEYSNSLVECDGWRSFSLTDLVRAAVARVVDFERIAVFLVLHRVETDRYAG